MNPSLTLACIAAATLSAFSANALTVSFTVPSGDWNVPSNWGGTLPGAADVAVVTNAREAIVTSAVVPAPGTIRIGNNTAGGTLTISSGSLTGGTFQAATAADSTGHLSIAGGTFTVTSSSFLSATGTVTGTSSTLTISGGTYNWGNTLSLGTTGTNLATVSGSSAVIAGANLVAGAGTTFTFNLGVAGVSAFTGTGALTINDGASLVVDLASYAGGAATIVLFDSFSGGITGGFGSNVTFLNAGALNPQLVADIDSISVAVVPEPSSYALLIGLGALAGIIWGRRRSA